MTSSYRRRPRESVLRQPRLRELRPIAAPPIKPRKPRRVLSPPALLFFGFLVLIAVGGFLLMLPMSSAQRHLTSGDVAFFTAISAVTVTGHVLVNTPTYWSHFGQVVIFFLMLVGGLGFMALTTFALALLGQRSSITERLALREHIGANTMQGLRRLARNIILVALGIYLLGAFAIFWRIQGIEGLSFGESVWQALFTSVSAFNNAGLSILPESEYNNGLARFVPDMFFQATMMALIVLGGIGWTALEDIYHSRGRATRLTLNTKLVLLTSLFLWVVGAWAMFFAEYTHGGTLGAMSLPEKTVTALFHSVSARTAGFNSIDFAQTGDFTKLVFSTLMFIGGASGSVAGGIKVNTFAVLLVAVVSSMRGRAYPEAFGREIPYVQVARALAVAMLSLALVFVVVPALILTEPNIRFVNLLFDTTSAFATAGLSTGVMPELSLFGKCVMMLTMFIGRLGPLTLALLLVPQEQATVYRFMQEGVKIG